MPKLLAVILANHKTSDGSQAHQGLQEDRRKAMLVRLRGWGDTDVLALLAVLRKNLLLYVYATDREFAEAVRGELPGAAQVEDLAETVHLLAVPSVPWGESGEPDDAAVATLLISR
jgi:hypothetical protein